MPDGATLLRRLGELPGFGTQKARILLALPGKQCGVTPAGWREAAGEYGEEGCRRSVADITDPTSPAGVRAHEQQVEQAATAAKAGTATAQPAVTARPATTAWLCSSERVGRHLRMARSGGTMGGRSRGLRGPVARHHRPPPPIPRRVQGRATVASSQQFPHRVPFGAGHVEPVLITEAEPSQDDQHAARKKRYLITMLIRGVSLVLAAATYQIVWLMIIFAVLGTVLPWIAVVMANDRPPKKRLDVNRYTAPRPDRILENPESSARVIDM